MNRTTKYFVLKKEDNFAEGSFFSGTFNSMEREMEWHRLTIGVGEEIPVSYKLSVYCSDYNVWEETINKSVQPLKEKILLMEQYLQISEWNASDIYLHGVKGQYLWILLEVYGPVIQDNYFKDIKVYFPKKSWITFLPEVYQKEDNKQRFLERYLGIFQTLYEDLNEKIDCVSNLFDLALADSNMLHWMASWLDIEESQIFTDDKLRILLAHAVSLFKKRGTREGMIELVEFYIEEECFLIENYQLESQGLHVTSYNQQKLLYPGNSAGFSLIVKDSALTGEKTKEGLMQIIEMMRPVQSACHLIILNPYLFLGGYAYLGINSGMERFKSPLLSENAVLSLTVLGSNKE